MQQGRRRFLQGLASKFRPQLNGPRANLPFCWTRFGAEAGELIDHIFRRKEEERIANQGVFIWGIGNVIGPSILELLQRTASPEVLFSPIKTPAKLQDVSPPGVAAWTRA